MHDVLPCEACLTRIEVNSHRGEYPMIQFKTVLCRLAKRMAILALLMATSVPKMNAQLAFSPPQKLTNSSASFNVPGEQLIAVDALGNVNVAWNASSNHADAMFSRSIDGGLTFSEIGRAHP